MNPQLRFLICNLGVPSIILASGFLKSPQMCLSLTDGQKLQGMHVLYLSCRACMSCSNPRSNTSSSSVCLTACDMTTCGGDQCCVVPFHFVVQALLVLESSLQIYYILVVCLGGKMRPSGSRRRDGSLGALTAFPVLAW